MTDNSEKDIKKQFEEIDNSYNESEGEKGEGVSLERKTVQTLTDDELENLARNSLEDYYSSGRQSLIASNEKSISSLNTKAENAIDNFEKNKETLNSEIENAKKSAENQAIRRGLARSSIIMNQLEDFDKMKIDKASQMEENLNKQISQINYEIDALSSRLEDSLKSFDLNYAVKLQNKINDLKEEQVKKIEKALEYNNQIALKEAEFNLKQKQQNAKTSTSNAVSPLNDVQKAKYKAASEYFASLSKDDALNELLNTSAEYFREHLGNYYYKLYNEIKTRK